VAGGRVNRWVKYGSLLGAVCGLALLSLFAVRYLREFGADEEVAAAFRAGLDEAEEQDGQA
jgi:hypothetical protein